MAWPSESNSAPWKALTSSGSRRSESEVNPQRSAKTTVTWRRSASACGTLGFAAATGSRGDPQRGQKAKSGSQAKPQLAQDIGCRRPQWGQKAKSAIISKPQPTQVIDIHPAERRLP